MTAPTTHGSMPPPWRAKPGRIVQVKDGGYWQMTDEGWWRFLGMGAAPKEPTDD